MAFGVCVWRLALGAWRLAFGWAAYGSGDCPAGVPDVFTLRETNGATSLHRPQNAVALVLLTRTARHGVMANDGDCALR
jgi:hypothetical protein